MSGDSGKERRNYIRIDYALPVQYRFVTEDKDIFRTGITGNVSREGIVLQIEMPSGGILIPLVNRQLLTEIKFRLPGLSDPIESKCSIVWVDLQVPDSCCQIGLEFDDLDERKRIELFKFAIAASGRTRKLWML